MVMCQEGRVKQVALAYSLLSLYRQPCPCLLAGLPAGNRVSAACRQPCQCLLAGLPASNRVSVYWQVCLQATVSVFTGRPACKQPCQCLLAGLPAGNRVSVSFTKQSKNGFLTPQKRHIALTNVNLVRSAVSNFTLIFAEVWDYSP